MVNRRYVNNPTRVYSPRFRPIRPVYRRPRFAVARANFRNFRRRAVQTVRRSGKNLWDSIMGALTALISNPINLMIIAVAVVFISTHILDSENSYFKKFVENLKSKESTKTLGSWIATNAKKTYGLIMSLVVVFAVSVKWRVQAFLTSFCVIIMFQEKEWPFYLISSLLSYLYLKIRNNHHKLMIAALVICFVLYNHFLV